MAATASIEHQELRPARHDERRQAFALLWRAARPDRRQLTLASALLLASRGARSTRTDLRQAVHRRVSAAAPSRRLAGRAIDRRHRDQRLHRERAALLSTGSTGRRGDAVGASPARERLQPRAAPADGVFRQGDHRSAGQPHQSAETIGIFRLRDDQTLYAIHKQSSIGRHCELWLGGS